MASRMKFVVAGSVTYIAAVTAGYYYSVIYRNQGLSGSRAEVVLDDQKRQQTYAKLASHYDQEIGGDEVVMGLSLIRWWNIRQAKGKVLEIGCGTGRNFSYYNMKNIDSLIAIDSVKEMVEVAKTKLPSDKKENIQLLQMNAHQLDFPDNSFDMIIDTFGLCSYEHPEKVLQELSRVLNKNNNASKILFIEHGQASYQWLNNLLHSQAQHHADHWGCIWNLDIEQIIRSAGLEILSISRFHFGTTYVITARPSISSTSPSITSSSSKTQ